MSINLDAIEARLAAVTPGPWEARTVSVKGSWGGKAREVHQVLPDNLATVGKRADADLIAHAPTDLAALVAEVRALRAVAEAALDALPRVLWDPARNRLRAALDAWRGGEGNE